MAKISVKGHASMLAANAMWGLMAPIAKTVMATGAVAPLVLTDLRIAGAMVLFWLGSLLMPAEHVCTKDMIRLFGASLLGIVFNQGSFIFGVQLTSPGDASIITTGMPLWAMILAAFILKEPITGKKVLGIATGATGALLLILGSRSQGAAVAQNPHFIWGDLLVLGAQFSYATYLVLYKNFVSKYSLFTIMKWMFTYGFICLIPFSSPALIATNWSALTGVQIGSVAYVVVAGTFLCYLLTMIGQRNLRPTVVGMYNYVQPIVACLVAVMWGLDNFNVVKGIAVVLIFFGVYLVTKSKARHQASETRQ